MITALSYYDIMRMADVKRWHIVEMARGQSLAEHSFTVAMMAFKFAMEHEQFHSCALDVLQYALIHDTPETEFGDIPTPTKRMLKIEDGATDEDFWNRRGAADAKLTVDSKGRDLVHFFDKVEAALYYHRFGKTPQFREGPVRTSMLQEVGRLAHKLHMKYQLPDFMLVLGNLAQIYGGTPNGSEG